MLLLSILYLLYRIAQSVKYSHIVQYCTEIYFTIFYLNTFGMNIDYALMYNSYCTGFNSSLFKIGD